MLHTLAICATCPRDARLAVVPLSADLQAMFTAADLPDFQLQKTHCLGACQQPCTVAFSASGKWRLRFSRLRLSHVAAVVATACLYHRSQDGLIARDDLPAGMAECLSSASPEGLMRSLGAPPPPLSPRPTIDIR